MLGAMSVAPVLLGAMSANAQAPAASSAGRTPTTGISGAVGDNARPRSRNIGIPSRHFQFTPSIDEAVELCKRAGFDCIEWNIRVGGHVPPDQVATMLPKAVEAARKAGLKCEQVCNSIQDANTPYAENILRAMQEQGIRFYRSSNYFQWNFDGDLAAQLDELKVRLATTSALNAKYNTVACFHTHPTIGDIGGNVWDFMEVFRELDPATIGFNYDTGHTTIRGGNGWRAPAIAAKKYLAALSIKDYAWQKGSGSTPNAPIWHPEWVPCGEGSVDMKARFEFLRDAGFSGPINIHYEHYGLYGTGIGDMSLDLTKEQMVRVIKRDVDYIRAVMKDARFLA